MPRRPDRPQIYDVTRRWLDVVAAGGGLFRPTSRVWTITAVEALHERIVSYPDTSQRGFQEKLGEQARAEGPAGQRLAAEALFVWQVKDSSGLPGTKRRQIDALLDGLNPPTSVPPDLDDAFTVGMARYGPGRRRSLNDYLFVLRLAAAWAHLDDPGRARLLSEPWEFRDFLHDLKVDGAVFGRDAMQHLVHPDTYSPPPRRTGPPTKRSAATGRSPTAPCGSHPASSSMPSLRGVGSSSTS